MDLKEYRTSKLFIYQEMSPFWYFGLAVYLLMKLIEHFVSFLEKSLKTLLHFLQLNDAYCKGGYHSRAIVTVNNCEFIF